jgi:hypothetical protein
MVRQGGQMLQNQQQAGLDAQQSQGQGEQPAGPQQ